MSDRKVVNAVVGIITGLAITAAMFVIGESIADRDPEIDPTQYQLVEMMANTPAVAPLINKAVADGKITQSEYNAINSKYEDTLREAEVLIIKLNAEKAAKGH